MANSITKNCAAPCSGVLIEPCQVQHLIFHSIAVATDGRCGVHLLLYTGSAPALSLYAVCERLHTKEFVWQGYTFPRGVRVLVDIYGTNHDGARWHLPEQFDPGRFYRWNDDPFD